MKIELSENLKDALNTEIIENLKKKGFYKDAEEFSFKILHIWIKTEAEYFLNTSDE